MSDDTTEVLTDAMFEAFLQELEEAGATTLSKLGNGLIALKDLFQAVENDYAQGDYSALVVDGLMATSVLAAGSVLSEVALGAIVGAALEGAAEYLAMWAANAIIDGALAGLNSLLAPALQNLANTLTQLAKNLISGAEQIGQQVLDSIVNQIGDLLSRWEDGYYDDRIKPKLKPFQWPSLVNSHDPLVLNFAGTTLNLTSESNSPVSFDFTGAGTPLQTGWITSGEGFLLLKNGSSNVASELLGAQSSNGFNDLKALDSNGDGVISAEDPAFASLEVWIDSNGNGQVDAGEIYTLSQLGIASISLTTTAVDGNINGNTVVSSATFYGANGSAIGTISEVNFQTADLHERYIPPAGFSYSSQALQLPQLDGYGTIADLQVAMSVDPSLLASVQSLVENASSMTGAEFDAAFQQIVLKWAGVSGVATDAYGPNVDGQHFALICALYDVDPSVQGDPNGIAGPKDEAAYRSIIDQLELRFVSQLSASEAALGVTPSSDPFAAFATVTYDPVGDTITTDPSSLIASIAQGAPTSQSSVESYYDLAFTAARGLNELYFNGDEALFAATVISSLDANGVDESLQQAALGGIGLSNILDQGATTGAIALEISGAVIYLGTGDKALTGGSGNIYVYSSSGGNSSISDAGADAAIAFTGLASTDVVLERPDDGNDLIVVNSSTGAILTVSGYFSNANYTDLSFNDGVSLTVAGTEQLLRSEAIAYLASTSDSVSVQQAQLGLFGFTSFINEGAQTGSVGGSAGVDILLVGTGNKSVVGDGGADIYVYSGDSGNVVIDDAANLYGGISDLVLSGFASTDVTLSRPDGGNDLVITVNSTGSTVTVAGEFFWTGAGSLASVTFSDGVSWKLPDIQSMLLNQESGADGGTVYGYFGQNDLLVAGPGDKTLVGGGNAAETYEYFSSDGNDVIDDSANLYGGVSTLVMSDINSTDVTLSRPNGGSNLVLTVNSTGKTVTVDGEFFWTGTGSLASITFADGVSLTTPQIEQMLLNQESAADGGTVYGYYGLNDPLIAGLGDKTLIGGGGAADTYVYTSAGGNAVIDDSANLYGGVSTLEMSDINSTDVTLSRPDDGDGGADLVLTVNSTGETVTVDGEFFWTGTGSLASITFADGVSWKLPQIEQMILSQESAADGGAIYGFQGGDTLIAGPGDKSLVGGGGGPNTYVYSSSGGNDTVSDPNNDTGTLQFSDIDSTDVTLSRPNGGNDLVITVNSTGKTVTVDSEFFWTGAGSLASITFADGVSWTLPQIEQMLLSQESAADGGSIVGFQGGDTLIAGPGDKSLMGGGGGANTYVYSSSGGNDTISDPNNGTGTLQFSDIDSTDVTLSRPNGGNDLVITFNSTGKTVTVDSEFFWSGAGSLASITFADGVSWTLPKIEQMVLSQESAADGGTIYGFQGGGTLIAGPGDKSLMGGGGGPNTYVYSSSDGNDTISDPNNDTGTLQFSDIDSTDVTLSQPNGGNDLVITVNSTGKTVTVDGEFFWTGAGSLASITFADGVSWNKGHVENILNGGGSSVDIFQYAKGDGNVTVNPNGVIDAINFAAGISAQDVYFEFEGSGDLVIKFIGDAADSIVVNQPLTQNSWGISSTISELTFADGTSMAVGQPAPGEGTALAFTWYGTTTDTTLSGGNYIGNTFVAGPGGDTINFGNESNTIEYAEGDGSALVNLGGGTGTIQMGSGLTASDVDLQADGYGNLFVTIAGDATDSIGVRDDLTDNSGTVTSGIKELQFSDGTSINLTQNPLTFTWLGNTTGFNIQGTNFGTNLFDVTASGGTINFGTGKNIVNYTLGAGTQIVALDDGTGVIDFGAGVTASDIDLQADGYGNLWVTIAGDAPDRIGIRNDLTDNSGTVSSGIQELQFSDGTSINLTQNPLTFTWLGNTANFNIQGTNFGTNLFDVTASGGTVNFGNTSQGGTGQNIVNYTLGAGTQIVVLDGGTGDIDFGAGVTASDIDLQADGYGNLWVTIAGDAPDRIGIRNDLTDNSGTVNSGIQEIEFSDGTSINLTQNPLTFTWLGNTVNFNIQGTNFGTNLFDVAASGGTVNFGNTSQGGTGQNIVNYTLGAGSVTVALDDGTGVIDFGAGVTASDVDLQADGYGDLFVTIAGDATDSIGVRDDLTDNSGTVTSGIKELQFSDGTSINLTQNPLTFTWLGNTTGFNIQGTNFGTNLFDVTASGGTINFGTGKNIVNYTLGAGSQTIALDGGTGVIDFGAGVTASDVDLQADGYGNLFVTIAGDATDSVGVRDDLTDSSGTVTSGIQELQFTDGTSINLGPGSPPQFTWVGTPNASLSGSGFGANTFILGAGSESSTGGGTGNGGNGNNTYVASSSTGQATINANAAAGSTNELEFVGGITDDNLWFERSGNNLQIDLLGSSTQVDVSGWFNGGSSQLQEITAGGLKIDSQISQLVQAMATYSSENPGFNPASAGTTSAPSDTGVQTAIAAAWHT